MEYIVYKRFKTKAICGDVNIPALSKCELTGPYICFEKKPLCVAASENAHNYFMRNDDGNGMLRGDLIDTIKKTLQNNKEKWDKVWEDDLCRKYRRAEHKDHWLWNHDFYNADIADLEYICRLVSA